LRPHIFFPLITKVIRKLQPEVWKYFDKQEDGKMKCKLCPWSYLVNATRLPKCWDEKHTEEEGEQPNNFSQAWTQEAPKKPKIEDHLDRNFTAVWTQRTQKRLTFAAIMNGWSPNSLAHKAFEDFCKALGKLTTARIFFHIFT